MNSGEAFGSQYDAASPQNREGFSLYQYDSRSEVTESKRFRGTNIADTSRPVDPEYRSYQYDPIGNRTASVEGCDGAQDGRSSTYAANGLNQYESAATASDSSCGGGAGPLADGQTHFTYDADGNMTSVADSTGYTLYMFDGENRLVEVRPNAPVSGQNAPCGGAFDSARAMRTAGSEDGGSALKS